MSCNKDRGRRGPESPSRWFARVAGSPRMHSQTSHLLWSCAPHIHRNKCIAIIASALTMPVQMASRVFMPRAGSAAGGLALVGSPHRLP
jgi:hypothetical protein